MFSSIFGPRVKPVRRERKKEEEHTWCAELQREIHLQTTHQRLALDCNNIYAFTCQECLVKQIVSRFRCPSDLTSFVKICAFVQLLEAVKE